MSSANFTYDDVIQAARQQIQDDAQRRWTDAAILTYILPRVLQQLRADRPDLWIGLYGTEAFKPSQSAAIPFDDAGYNTLVEALVAAINEEQDESASDGVAAFADSRSERARRT
jgi:hypothetical protein